MAIIAPAAFMSLIAMCAPTVHPKTMYSIVKTESGFNEFAIGVVGNPLDSQPKSLNEAIGVVDELVKQGKNFSVGLGQINRYNFDITKPELAFNACNNINMAAQNLEYCYDKYKEDGATQQRLLKAISCYYSGNKEGGFKLEPQFGNTSHVQRVLASAETYKIGALETSEGAGVSNEQPAQNNPQLRPVYSSWDVLRQYPRYVPVTDLPGAAQEHAKKVVKPDMESVNE